MYARLNRLGVCVSHPTVTKLVRLGAKDHERKVKLWKDNWSKRLQHTSASTGSSSSDITPSCDSQNAVEGPCSFIIIGDNLDKTVKPRDMRVDHQVQSLHYFHSYAALDRVDFSGLSTETVARKPDDIMAIPTSAILPTAEDCTTLRSNYTVLVARTVADRLPYFKCLKDCAKHLSCSL